MISRSLKNVLRSVIALAIALLFVACQSDEEKLDEFFAKGQEYESQEKYQEAVIEYKNVLKINPNHADAHYQLAQSFLKLNRARDSYWEMSETVRLDPSNIEAALSFGALSVVAGDSEQALAMGLRAVEGEPENKQGYYLTGKALERLDRRPEAEEYYLKAYSLDSEDWGGLLTVASYYASMPDGGREKAEPWYWKGVEKFRNFQARTALARFLVQDPARTDEAEVQFKEALEQNRHDANLEEGHMNLARFYFSTDRGEDGVAILEKGIELVPDSSSIIFMLATYYRIEGDFDRAEALIRQAAEIDPTDSRPYLVLSSFLGGRDDLDGALAAAEKALEVDPESADTKLRRAELLVDLGFREASAAASETPEDDLAAKSEANPKIREGLRIVDEILVETPFQPQAEFVRGKANLAKGDSQKGIEAFRAAAEGRPDWAQAHFALGSALASEEQFSLARVEIARALELDPGIHQARLLLASIHQALSEHEYAIEQGRRYLRIFPNDNATRVLVAQSLIRLGKHDLALKELNAVPADQYDVGILFALGRVHASLGNPAKAREYLMRVLEAAPHNQKVLRTLFKIDRSDSEDFAETKKLIMEAAKANADDGKTVQLHGMVLFADGDFEGAEAAFVRATELMPDDVETYQQLARFYTLTGRTDETIATYEKAVEHQPTSARLHHFLALLYEAQGELGRAEQSYENAIKYDDNHAFAKNNLAYLLADTGKDLDRALDLAQDAKALLPNDPNAADTLGWVLFKRGVSGAAVGYLKESVENADADDPALGVMRHHLAQAYEADGNQTRAVEVLKTAIADLEQRKQAQKAQGRDPQSPPWESDVRSMLERLSAT
ncbi:MAG: tetratricopeptide repeat protein [Deltaproteobacteria bacterium]|nr:tetratricopeptide repeat protein [Deltaproteobacteria bacterium]